MVGCGNSSLSAQLYEGGYHFITNVDFSATLVDEMRRRNEALEEMDYVEIDITDKVTMLEEDSF